ncbi:MAG: MFS transporter [Alphaproteobacteria bacterium]
MNRHLLIILIPFSLTPMVSFLYRMANAVIAPDLVDELDLDAAGLGLLTSAFFIGFGLTQLPLGMALDRWGPRRVAALLFLVGGIGGVIFATGTSVLQLGIGRALMGVGMACSVMAGLKAANLWFPPGRVPLLTSFFFGMTGVGGMLATVPLAALLQTVHWRDALLGIAACAVLVAVLLFLLVPEKPPSATKPPGLHRQLRDLGAIFSSLAFWRYTPLAAIAIGASAAYQSLWVVPWLRDIAGFDRQDQALGLFLILAGSVVGNFGFGALTQVLARRGIPLMLPVLAGFVGCVAIQAVFATGYTGAVLPMWFLFGVLAAGPIGLYAVLGPHFPVELSARVSTAMNLCVFLTSFAFQWLVGVVIDLWPHRPDGTYDPDAHAAALVFVIAAQLLALAWFAASARVARTPRGRA